MWVNGVGLILVYHRVAKVGCDPWGLCVSPENFAEQLQVLREFGPCMTVGEMVRRLHAGQLPRRAVAVSFDDGYADNLHTALPLLEQHGVPATFFLSAGLLDGVSEFWWDELERILLHPSTLPEELELDVAGLTFRRQLGAGVTLSDGDYLLHRRWLYTEPPPTERHVLYLELWSLLRPLPHNHRAGLLARLASWAGAGVEPRESHRPMSAEEACSLGRNGLVEIGAHTMTHPLLPALSKERQRNEISKSKSTSEAIWGRPVESFSYPHGGFSGLTADLVRAEGFASACTSRHGPAGNRNDRFQLPRFTVGDWSGAELEARLEQWV
jgi:peptidoglycan/xylan/chitin deacetylase (PgdA/CDA1 family)